jgi:hypothetical protein
MVRWRAAVRRRSKCREPDETLRQFFTAAYLAGARSAGWDLEAFPQLQGGRPTRGSRRGDQGRADAALDGPALLERRNVPARAGRTGLRSSYHDVSVPYLRPVAVHLRGLPPASGASAAFGFSRSALRVLAGPTLLMRRGRCSAADRRARDRLHERHRRQAGRLLRSLHSRASSRYQIDRHEGPRAPGGPE